MTFSARNVTALVKDETDYGVDASPDGTNALFLISVDLEPVYEDNPNEEITDGGNASPSAAPSAVHWKYKIEFYLRGSGDDVGGVTNKPAYAPVLRGCGLAVSEVGNTQKYVPDIALWLDKVNTAFTMYVFFDGKRFILTGCKGDLTIEAEAGKQVKCTVEGLGLYTEPDDSPAPSVTQGEAAPMVARDCQVAIGGISADEMKATKISFKLGNAVVAEPSLNAANAISGIIIDGRQAMLEIDPEMTATTAHNLYNVLTAGGLHDFTVRFGAGIQHNTMTLSQGTSGGVAFKNAPGGERHGKRVHEGLSLKLEAASKDEDFEMVFS